MEINGQLTSIFCVPMCRMILLELYSLADFNLMHRLYSISHVSGTGHWPVDAQ